MVSAVHELPPFERPGAELREPAQAEEPPATGEPAPDTTEWLGRIYEAIGTR